MEATRQDWKRRLRRDYRSVGSLSSGAKGLQDHPTVKPTEMLQEALIDLTHREEFVLEPFGGSESTLIACEKIGRVCRRIELCC
ncbi:MAG: DNA methyltransferase [Rhodoblastus sp.]|jgi:DNA modification methylase